jgi:HlyD family secretion protein
MRKKIWIIIVIVIVLAGVGLGLKSCGKKAKAKAAPKPQQESYTVVRGRIVSKIEITGEIQPQITVQIKSKVSGKIMKFYADENDYVKTGQIIADIEPDYNQASTLASVRSRLKNSEIRLKNAEKDLSDKTQMVRQNYVSQKEADLAQDELEQAKLEHQQAVQQYELVKELDTGGKVTHVYATASGTVIQRPVQEGEMIVSSNTSYGEGSVIMKVADLSRMIVKSNINEVDIAKFKPGQTASIKVDALPYEEFTGRITKIAPMAITDNNARVFPVEISFTKPGSQLKPGMTGNVSIIGATKDNVLVIPIRAVFTDDKNQDIVYLYKSETAKPAAPKGKPSADKTPAAPRDGTGLAQTIATPVRLGSNDLQIVEVVEGLKEGDKISFTEPVGKSNMDMEFDAF